MGYSNTVKTSLITDRFLTLNDVLAITRLGKTTIYRLIKNNHFPKQIKIKHTKKVLWSEYAIYQWMKAQKAGGVA